MQGVTSDADTVRDEWVTYLNVNPDFDELHTDPRFQVLVRRVGLSP